MRRLNGGKESTDAPKRSSKPRQLDAEMPGGDHGQGAWEARRLHDGCCKTSAKHGLCFSPFCRKSKNTFRMFFY